CSRPLRITLEGGNEPLAGPTDGLSPFDAASPLDARYYFADREFFQELSPFVSEAAQVRFLAEVEAALVETLADIGLCGKEVAEDIRRACAAVTPAEVYEEEARIQHNVRALVNCIRRRAA